jgi:hypothetical protein
VDLSFKTCDTSTEIEELARKVSGFFVTHPDVIKLDLTCKNEEGEDEVIGVVYNPKMRNVYEQIEWMAQRQKIKTTVRTVKVGK